MANYVKSLINSLSSYYGTPSDITVNYIVKTFVIESEEHYQQVKDYIFKNNTKNFGFPDIQALDKAFQSVPKHEKKSIYYAMKCRVCGTYYSSNMIYCPECWKQGYKVNKAAVKISDTPIDYISFNKNSCNRKLEEAEGEKLCYDCEHSPNSYCKHFGDPNYNCEFRRECHCLKCCVHARKFVNTVYSNKPDTSKLKLTDFGKV